MSKKSIVEEVVEQATQEGYSFANPTPDVLLRHQMRRIDALLHTDEMPTAEDLKNLVATYHACEFERKKE